MDKAKGVKAALSDDASKKRLRKVLTEHQIVAIAEDAHAEAYGSIGKQHNVGKQQVRRAIASTAYVNLLTQALLIQLIRSELEDDPPQWTSNFPMWRRNEPGVEYIYIYICYAMMLLR
jgi:hypothetical protein